ncbi:FkbM family methyltransferase [Pseudothauera nasutitermitis]|uniref:FkbM family methyltransferase n=1 Tax=Pseudothauera nasutitermitis TaxID=2565930 RepID=A0A4S4AZS0_9RHOO|nr:FkbM family methyltransferase [Pseudothauera nasutitermitis]THF65689.1 FkbM family methyltransferase [Pseudothauera nasutitermitis]
MNIIDLVTAASPAKDHADFIENTLGSRFAEVRDGKIPFIVHGAGSAGARMVPVFRALDLEPVAVTDNAPEKIGSSIQGLPVLDPETAHARHPSAIVTLAAGKYQQEIAERLRSAGFGEDQIVRTSPDALRFYTHIEQWRWTTADLARHAPDLEKTYALLSDDESRRIFVQRLALLHNPADYRSWQRHLAENSFVRRYPPPQDKGAPESHYYFNNDILRLGTGEILVDCGAFDGDTLYHFLKRKPAGGKYVAHCLEPDSHSFAKLHEVAHADPDVFLYRIGAWSEKATLYFENLGTTDSRISRAPTPTRIEVDRLDDLLLGRPVSIIKMDIEGAERQALRGARALIRENRPALLISVYHRRDDLFEIPGLIDEIVPGYRYYLRLFSDDFTELVLLAVPERDQDE